MTRSFDFITKADNGMRRRVTRVVAVMVVLALSVVSPGAPPKKPKKNIPLILKSADSNENTYRNNAFVSYLRGNVVFVYDAITVRSDEATWWRDEGKIHFTNNITVNQESNTLVCDRMKFTRENNSIEATGNFIYRDTTAMMELSGEKAVYFLDNKQFVLSGSPRLLQVDTAAAETLSITGKKMVYNDSLKLATVHDKVIITRGNLTSRCDIAHYQTEVNIARLRQKPFVSYDISEIVGDSIDLEFGEKTLRNASVYGNAHGIYVDTGGAKKDSVFTNVWGDSLFMSVSDSGTLDSLRVRGNAASTNYTAQKKDVVNQAKGKRMLIAFGSDGTIDRIRIWGNARSTYYIEEGGGTGVNESTGDSILVAFSRGKAVFLNLSGSARGKFIPGDVKK